jgi:hypothetical protein
MAALIDFKINEHVNVDIGENAIDVVTNDFPDVSVTMTSLLVVVT